MGGVSGDCEDYALAKRDALIAAGIGSANARIATGVLPSGEYHAMLIVSTKRGDFVLDNLTNEWTLRAARGECGWICSDCCMSFPDGMPDECAHGVQSCTDIIKLDKQIANNGGNK